MRAAYHLSRIQLYAEALSASTLSKARIAVPIPASGLRDGARLGRGTVKPDTGIVLTSCLDAYFEDTNGDGVVDENDELIGLCSVGDGNILVQTRIVGSGKEQNRWDNVGQELLTASTLSSRAILSRQTP